MSLTPTQRTSNAAPLKMVTFVDIGSLASPSRRCQTALAILSRAKIAEANRQTG